MRPLHLAVVLALAVALAVKSLPAEMPADKPALKKAADPAPGGEDALPAPIYLASECEPNPNPGPADPKRAIVLIRMGNSQCSATFIKPRLASGKWHVLTANHCLHKGQKCTVRLDDGRTVVATAVASEQQSDICWLETDVALGAETPALELSSELPQAGTKVWHQGFGVDKPRNREEGQVVTPIDQNGQTRFWLSVSPGDSGGGICRVDNNKVLSPVCCTTKLSGPGWVWAGSCVRAWQLRPGGGKPAEIVGMKNPASAPYPAHPRTTLVPVLILSGTHGLNGH